MRRYPHSQRVPPLPNFTVFVDRADGTEWVLSHAVQDNITYVSLNTAGLDRGSLPPRTDYVRGDNFGLGRGVRLFVRDGYLGFEVDDDNVTTPVHTRRGVERETHELIIPSTWDHDSAELGWIEESLI